MTREEALTVLCPRCGADVGHGCKSYPSGTEMTTAVHFERQREAERNQAKKDAK